MSDLCEDEGCPQHGTEHACIIGTLTSVNAELLTSLFHHWSGWPGAFCMKCGCEDPMEVALGDGLWEPNYDKKPGEEGAIRWLGTPEQLLEIEAKNVCPVRGNLVWNEETKKFDLKEPSDV